MHPESQREWEVFCKDKEKGEGEENGIVQWREDDEPEVAAWSSRRRAMHPSFMIKHSEARKTYRVRRYMIAQVSWVRADNCGEDNKKLR